MSVLNISEHVLSSVQKTIRLSLPSTRLYHSTRVHWLIKVCRIQCIDLEKWNQFFHSILINTFDHVFLDASFHCTHRVE